MSTDEPVQIGLHFGAMSDPIGDQLRRQGVQPVLVKQGTKHWQEAADAITKLSLWGHLSAAETDRARKRLMKSICRDLEKLMRVRS